MTRAMHKRTRTSPPKRLRAFVVLVAAVSLFAQISSFAHFLLVRHVVCPEHGELIHAGDADHAAVHSSRQESDGETPASRGLAAFANGHEHDHCSLLSQRREQWALPAQGLTLKPPPAIELSTLEWTSTSVQPLSIPRFLLAPKGSPPA